MIGRTSCIPIRKDSRRSQTNLWRHSGSVLAPTVSSMSTEIENRGGRSRRATGNRHFDGVAESLVAGFRREMTIRGYSLPNPTDLLFGFEISSLVSEVGKGTMAE